MDEFLVNTAAGAMTSLLGKLATKLANEYKLLKGVRRDIEYLKDELEAMEAFLLMMADVEEPDHQARRRADKARKLSYDIKDKIDKFMLLVSHESSSKSERFKKLFSKSKIKELFSKSKIKELFSKSMKKITSLKKRHKIAKDVKDIKSKVKEEAERRTRWGN